MEINMPFFLALIGLLVATVVALQIDDPLLPEARKLLERAESHADGEAYFYLMGIDAPADQDPAQAGRAIFKDVLEHGQKPSSESTKLELPAGDLFCAYRDSHCLETITAHRHEIDQVLNDHHILEQRYQHFMQMPGFRMRTKPAVDEVFPSYQYLVRGNRLICLKAISESLTGGSAEAVEDLRHLIIRQRYQLQQADNLIGKMVYTVLLSETIDALAIIVDKDSRETDNTIEFIKPAERDLSIVIAREFAMTHKVLKDLDRNPAFWNEDDKVPGWLVRVVFKPNLTTNATYPNYSNAIQLSLLTPIEFAQRTNAPELFTPQPSYLRNYAGTKLNEIAAPQFEIYIARLFDLNLKIALFNATRGKDDDAILEKVMNPYSGVLEAPTKSADGKSICLKGPLEDKHNYRCLRVRI